MKRVGVILSGCGVQDGAEIHESTAVLLSLAKRGIEAVCLAPEGPQARVMNHATGTPLNESRDMLVEAARIARGPVTPLSQAPLDELDGLILPGGFGAALNLSDFAGKGREMTIHPQLEPVLNAAVDAGKPLCALCIAPPILAKLMQLRGVRGARLTIGNDAASAAEVEAMQATHVEATAREAVVDEANRLVTGPAYMLAGNVAELFEGIDTAIEQFVGLANG